MDCNSNFQESNTFRNLQTAFDGETRVSTKYAIYGRKAKEEGYEQIGRIFEEASCNEREHANIWLKLMTGGELPSTLENLKASYSGENYEWTTMYISFAQEARREGFEEIAELFEGVAAIERYHDSRFRKLASNIMNNTVFDRNNNVFWICLNLC